MKTISTYDLACGKQLFIERENGNSKRLYKEANIYHFVFRRTGWMGQFHWQSFDTLAEARKAWREVKI